MRDLIIVLYVSEARKETMYEELSLVQSGKDQWDIYLEIKVQKTRRDFTAGVSFSSQISSECIKLLWGQKSFFKDKKPTVLENEVCVSVRMKQSVPTINLPKIFNTLFKEAI